MAQGNRKNTKNGKSVKNTRDTKDAKSTKNIKQSAKIPDITNIRKSTPHFPLSFMDTAAEIPGVYEGSEEDPVTGFRNAREVIAPDIGSIKVIRQPDKLEDIVLSYVKEGLLKPFDDMDMNVPAVNVKDGDDRLFDARTTMNGKVSSNAQCIRMHCLINSGKGKSAIVRTKPGRTTDKLLWMYPDIDGLEPIETDDRKFNAVLEVYGDQEVAGAFLTDAAAKNLREFAITYGDFAFVVREGVLDAVIYSDTNIGGMVKKGLYEAAVTSVRRGLTFAERLHNIIDGSQTETTTEQTEAEREIEED